MGIRENTRNFRGKIKLEDKVLTVAVPKNDTALDAFKAAKYLLDKGEAFLGSFDNENNFLLSGDFNRMRLKDFRGYHNWFDRRLRDYDNYLKTSGENSYYAGVPYNFVRTKQIKVLKDRIAENSNLTREVGLTSVDTDKDCFVPFLSEVLELNSTTDSISTSQEYIDLSSYPGSKTGIPEEGYLTIEGSGGTRERIYYSYYDPSLDIVQIETRAMSGDDLVSHTAPVRIFFHLQNHVDNFDVLSEDLIENLDVYIVPLESYVQPHISHRQVYERVFFNEGRPDCYDSRGLNLYNYPPTTRISLYLAGIKPQILTSNTLAGHPTLALPWDDGELTDAFFTDASEAYEGYLYRYCEEGETCGRCMSTSRVDGKMCIVNTSTRGKVKSGEIGLLESVSSDEDDSWNSKNKLENFYIPVIGGGILAFVSLVFLLTFVGSYLNNDKKFLEAEDQNDFIDQTSKSVRKSRIGAIVVGFLLVFVIAFWFPLAYFQNGQVFPFEKLDRSRYDPPPGYIIASSFPQ